MSKDNRNHDQLHHFFSLQDDLSSLFTQRPSSMITTMDATSFVNEAQALPSTFVSFTDFLHGSTMDYGALSKAFDLSCLPNDGLLGSAMMPPKAQLHELAVDTTTTTTTITTNSTDHLTPSSACGGGTTTPVTPNSSVSSSSTEAVGDEELGLCKKDKMKHEKDEHDDQKQEIKDDDDQEESDKLKKVNKPRKKGEKRQREPRFAFMTKSEVDHLEDGYRWRKYGQKAVKNSPYPRSYYRCTTQKCSVKKRVERSYQDPSIVITTYEGQHVHPSPATVRGSSHLFAPPLSSSSLNQEFLMHQMSPLSTNIISNASEQQRNTNHNLYLQNLPTSLQLQLQYADYGLLQDIAQSFIRENQP